MSGLICITGSKGSPGATTLALTMAATATVNDSTVLVDADPDGGDLASILGLAANPGLVTLAAAARHRSASGELELHLQPVTPTLRLLATPASPDQTIEALTRLGQPFANTLAGTTAIADIGRWRPATPAAALVSAATATVVVLHPTVAGVAHARSVFADLAGRCPHVVVATRGDRPYGPDEVAAAIGCESVVVLPADRTAVSLLAAGVNDRWLRRSILARSVRALAETVWATERPVAPQHVATSEVSV